MIKLIMPPDMKKFTVRLPEILIEKLTARAREDGLQTAAYVRRVLEDSLQSPARSEMVSWPELERWWTRALKIHLVLDHQRDINDEKLREIVEGIREKLNEKD